MEVQTTANEIRKVENQIEIARRLSEYTRHQRGNLTRWFNGGRAPKGVEFKSNLLSFDDVLKLQHYIDVRLLRSK